MAKHFPGPVHNDDSLLLYCSDCGNESEILLETKSKTESAGFLYGEPKSFLPPELDVVTLHITSTGKGTDIPNIECK
jgi:hypothetical protein